MIKKEWIVILKVIHLYKCNIKKIKLFDIFDKEIYNWFDKRFITDIYCQIRRFKEIQKLFIH